MGPSKVTNILDTFLQNGKNFRATVQFGLDHYNSEFSSGDPVAGVYEPLVAMMFLHCEDVIYAYDSFLEGLQPIITNTKLPPEIRVQKMANYIDAQVKRGIYNVFLKYFENYPRARDLLEHLEKVDVVFPEVLERVESSASKAAQKSNLYVYKLKDIIDSPIQEVCRHRDTLKNLIEACGTPAARGDSRCALETLGDITDSVRQIITEDSRNLRRLERIQNNMRSLPETWGENGGRYPTVSGMTGRHIWEYGRLHFYGYMKIKGGKFSSSTSMFIIILDRLVVLCQPIGHVTARGQMYQFHSKCADDDLSHFRVERSYQDKDEVLMDFKPSPEEDPIKYRCRFNNNNDAEDCFKAAFWMDISGPVPVRGHTLELYQFSEPEHCAVCNKLIKGIHFQGYKCVSASADQDNPKREGLGRKPSSLVYSSGCQGSFHNKCLPMVRTCQSPRRASSVYSSFISRCPLRLESTYDWDAGEMSASQAELLLQACKRTAFMIRKEPGEASSATYLSIGHVAKNSGDQAHGTIDVKHVPIKKTKEGEHYIGEAPALKFMDLSELIACYSAKDKSILPGYEGSLGVAYRLALKQARRDRGALYFEWLKPAIKDDIILEFGLGLPLTTKT